MADLQVIHDTTLEIAAIVDLDRRCAWGPAMVGPQANVILETFLDTVPFDMSNMTTQEATDAFTSFLERAAMAAPAQAAATADGAVEPLADSTVDNEAALATKTAAAATDVPPPAPHDTDTTAATSAETKVIPCGNCNGSGQTPDGPDGTNQTCALCKGTGRVAVPVTSA